MNVLFFSRTPKHALVLYLFRTENVSGLHLYTLNRLISRFKYHVFICGMRRQNVLCKSRLTGSVLLQWKFNENCLTYFFFLSVGERRRWLFCQLSSWQSRILCEQILRDEPLEITGAGRGRGWKCFSACIFFSKPTYLEEFFLSGVWLFFSGIIACRILFREVLLQEYFLGNCHPPSIPNPAEVMFSLQRTMLEAMTDISIFVRRHLPRTDGKASYRRLPLFGRISRAGMSTSLSVCMINTWYICRVSGQVGEMDVNWSEVVSYRRSRLTYRSTQPLQFAEITICI